VVNSNLVGANILFATTPNAALVPSWSLQSLLFAERAALRNGVGLTDGDLACRLPWVPVAAILVPAHTRPSGGPRLQKLFFR
jgi:hypothetical protein